MFIANNKGGVISFGSVNKFSSINTFSHESFHAYQLDQMGLNNSTGIEIEAMLFANSVAYDLKKWDQMIMLGGNNDFNNSVMTLQCGSSLDWDAWRTAIESFPRNVGDGRYRNLTTTVYEPLIQYFYPLFK